MKVLVTGGAGFIGTNLIKRLVKENYVGKIVSVDNYSTGLKLNHIEGVQYENYDIRTINDYSAWGEFDLVFHLAALARIQESFKNPKETFDVNTVGTQKICEFARNKNVKLVYAGSSSRWCDPHSSPYSTSKFLGEEIIKMYRKTYNLDLEIARFYNVYGPHEIVGNDWAAVIGKWRNQVKNNEPITIVDNGEQRRDFTYVEDIVDGLIKIGFSDKKHKDAWELGTGLNYSINDVYLIFKERFGVDYINIPNQPGNYKKTLRVNDDSLNKLGWKPKDRLRDYILSLDK
jgi:UDP-glucose 4-epimerase